MNKTEIRTALDAAGIEYDARQSAENLAKLLPEAKAPSAPGMIVAHVLRDYWPTGDDMDRVRKGQIVEVTAEQMIEGLEAGTLRRVR